MRARFAVLLAVFLLGAPLRAQDGDAAFVRAHYDKREALVPMRDGVKLFTQIYAPKDSSREYPILLFRTPYSVSPYGAGEFRGRLGPHLGYTREGFIFVRQDVRGCYLSEGGFRNMTPHRDAKRGAEDVDESSDTYDTIAWLLENVAGHNGRVGQWGISYPGFYAAAGMIDAHPALKAVSPQAPIADWWYDDFHHHGAFFLPHTFNFISRFGLPRPEPTTEGHPRFDHGTKDGYRFFLDLGSLANVNARHFHGRVAFWNEAVAHPNYDEFWQARNLLPHLNNVAPAVLTVGGWYDAEDLYGPLQIYRATEAKNPGVFNVLVMGPWSHGGWTRTEGDRLGNARFGAKQSFFYRDEIELPFFRHFLKDEGGVGLAEATMFETGANRWRRFEEWPPRAVQPLSLHLDADGGLSFTAAAAGGGGFDEFVSDPARPVPFTEEIAIGMTKAYMTDDQRFASRRPDVLVYQTEPLEEPLTLAGPVLADLWVSTSGTDSDWIVKLIDVFPPDAEDPPDLPDGFHYGGYQQMVRSEVMRGRFRNDPSKPEPFEPNEPTRVRLPLQDVLHTFLPGHRVMVQVQCTWFPLVDRNPQQFVPNIYLAQDSDFVRATQRVYATAECPSQLQVGVLPPADAK